MEKVLDAAESVIAEVGIDHATTNAIAARAGSGMGSLYHFFPNKEAIVQALSERYSRRMRALVDYPSRPELAGVPLARLADLVVDPLVAFMRRSPAYWHVFHAAHAAGTTGACEDDLYQVIVSNVDVLIGARAPHVTPARRRVLAMVMVELVHALLAAAFQAPAKQRRPIIRETKRLLALHAEMIQNGDDPLQRLR